MSGIPSGKGALAQTARPHPHSPLHYQGLLVDLFSYKLSQIQSHHVSHLKGMIP